MFASNFAPSGWMLCEGQLLAISENETLFQLIGTTYGGDGQSTFALPDLRGRIPIHFGNGYILSQTGGTEEITLTINQIPAHTHPALANSSLASTGSFSNAVPATSTADVYNPLAAPTVSFNPAMISTVGGSQPHTNFQPYLCVNFIISLYGIFPSPT